MNELILNYVFDKDAKTITLTDLTNIKKESVRFIRNLTTNSFIYSFSDLSLGDISVATNVITFTGSNTGMNNLDVLVIQYYTRGQKTNSNSLPVVISSEQSQDIFITGQAGQSALNNNIFLEVAGTGSIDTFSNGITYRSFYCQIIGSAGITSGSIIFEGSNNGVIFHTLVVQDDGVATGAVLFSSVSILANTNRFFSGRTGYRYIRCRISTAFVGGTIQALTTFSSQRYFAKIRPVSQATGQSFSTTISSSLPVGSAVIGAVNLTNGVATTDIASAALTISATTAAITQGNVASCEFTINVTVASGTNPTLDVQIQISKDGGTNWTPIYDFPRITAIGSYSTPLLKLEGNRIRYVQTVGGTSPSFTRTLIRNSYNGSGGTIIRQQFDRSISITTLNSTTPSLRSEGCNEAILVFSTGASAITTAAIITLEGSEDNSNWYDLGNITVTGTAINSTYQNKVSGILSKFLRAKVSTAGVGGSLNYVSIKTRG